MSLTRQDRDRMIGKRFHSNMNDPDEFAVTVQAVKRSGMGFTIVFSQRGCRPVYMPLSTFNRFYPYEVRS
ncbi:hypothetical protein PEC302107_35910 [Pectobacterium araliae]|nr:hypothetical protein PEC302107_35910 [Pectobacterium carotovorum subsp. carotovorum]